MHVCAPLWSSHCRRSVLDCTRSRGVHPAGNTLAPCKSIWPSPQSVRSDNVTLSRSNSSGSPPRRTLFLQDLHFTIATRLTSPASGPPRDTGRPLISGAFTAHPTGVFFPLIRERFTLIFNAIQRSYKYICTCN